MKHTKLIAITLSLLCLVTLNVTAQTISNKKLSPTDLGAAQSEMKSAGGKEATLVYATRLDAAVKGIFDSLVVVYEKGGETYAMVVRQGKRLMLAGEKGGTALKAGQKMSQMGVRYEDGKAPLLRLFAGNVGNFTDYRFNGTEFVLESR